MRVLPIVIAIVVAVVLYGIVFERETFRELVRGAPQGEQVAEAAQAAQEDTEVAQGVGDSAAAPQTDGAIDVVVLTSTANDIDNTVILRGRTEADRQVDVRAQIDGLVISDPLRKGSFVKEGQLLCEIDPGTRFAALEEARASLAEAEISNTAAERLVQGGFTSETQAVAAKAAWQAAQASVTRAETNLARLQIKAPFDGLLETDSAELGTLLQPGDPCATVIQLDPIRLVGFLPEISVNAVKTGAMAHARLSDGRVVSGEVSFVSRSADPTTRTFRVDIEVANEDLSIRDGQTAEIAITADASKAHLVPQSALTLNDEGTMGLRYVDASNIVHFTPVAVVRDTEDGMLVTGLPDTAKVIVTGQEYVTDGVEVVPHEAGDRS